MSFCAISLKKTAKILHNGHKGSIKFQCVSHLWVDVIIWFAWPTFLSRKLRFLWTVIQTPQFQIMRRFTLSCLLWQCNNIDNISCVPVQIWSLRFSVINSYNKHAASTMYGLTACPHVTGGWSRHFLRRQPETTLQRSGCCVVLSWLSDLIFIRSHWLHPVYEGSIKCYAWSQSQSNHHHDLMVHWP